jgi:HD-GYP domain-containing protein (c-di-GMP phosphodiesterase class II)
MLRSFYSRLSLLSKFTLVSLILTSAIAVVLVIGLQQRLENDALLQVANSAAHQVALIMDPNLSAADLQGPIPPARYKTLDFLIREDILLPPIVHVNIYSPDGSVLYSDQANLVGQKYPISSELSEALSGNIGMEVSNLTKPENATERVQYSRLLEVYVPLQPRDAPNKVLGAYEIYQDLSVIQPTIDDMRLYVSGSVAIGFLVLFGSLFFLVRNASRQLLSRNEENSLLYQETKQQVLDLKLAEEQSQRRYQRLIALRAIDEAISATHDLSLTLRIFLDQATMQLQVDAADILLLGQSADLLTFAAGRGFRTEQANSTSLHLGEGYAGRAALEQHMLSILDLAQVNDFGRTQLVKMEGISVYYVVPLISRGEVRGVLEIFNRSPLTPDRDWLEFLEGLAKQASIAIGDAELFDNLQRSNIQLVRAYDATITGWSHALDLRDRETEGHTQRVTELTQVLGIAFGIRGEDLVNIRRGALLHDIGKMGIPDDILLKPGPLTDVEWEIMRKHPGYANDMLSSIEYLRPALHIPYCHHEKWDGSGYPRGLRGTQIPFSARMFAVVDVWDALRSDRPYRKAWTETKVREYILEQAGIHFEQAVVVMFLKMLDRR